MPKSKSFSKVIHLRFSNRMLEKMKAHAKVYNEIHEMKDKASLQSWIRSALNFAMDHPNHSEKVRRKLTMICTLLETRDRCPIRPSDVLYEALADLEKKYNL